VTGWVCVMARNVTRREGGTSLGASSSVVIDSSNRPRASFSREHILAAIFGDASKRRLRTAWVTEHGEADIKHQVNAGLLHRDLKDAFRSRAAGGPVGRKLWFVCRPPSWCAWITGIRYIYPIHPQRLFPSYNTPHLRCFGGEHAASRSCLPPRRPASRSGARRQTAAASGPVRGSSP
jgi:hypothetical protein